MKTETSEGSACRGLTLLRPFSPAAEDSSDDDEPLIKMVKAAPSEEQLKDTVKSLLNEANLEEMTMKQICQRVRAATWRPAEDLLLLTRGSWRRGTFSP